MMAKSSKVLSLSGLSCIMVGLIALLACGVAKHILYSSTYPNYQKVYILTALAFILLVVCVLIIFLFAKRKAKKNGQRFIFDQTMRHMIWSFSLPLFVGGVLCFCLISQGHYGLTSSFMLIFYGLSVTNLSNYTFSSTKYLGYAHLVLGLADFVTVTHSLLFWGLGFGVCHIIYGTLFYFFKERKNVQ